VARKPQKLIIVVCDCMPSISSKAAVGGIARLRSVLDDLSKLLRSMRKCWSLSGKVAHEDILDIIEDLPEEIKESLIIAASAACIRPAVVKGDKAATRFVEEPQSQYPGRDSWIHRGIDPQF
jgi:hypothetical protein